MAASFPLAIAANVEGAEEGCEYCPGRIAATVQGAEQDCEYCPGRHLLRDTCPVLRDNMASFYEQQNLLFDALEAEDKTELLRTCDVVEKIWDDHYAIRQKKFKELKKSHASKEIFLMDSLKMYAKLKRTIDADEIKPLGEDDDETQACLYCSSFHCTRDCPVFLKKKEELLQIRAEKIAKWEEEMSTELREMVDDQPETWDSFKMKYVEKFRKMYISQREEEKRSIKNLCVQATVHAVMFETPDSSDPAIDESV